MECVIEAGEVKHFKISIRRNRSFFIFMSKHDINRHSLSQRNLTAKKNSADQTSNYVSCFHLM